MSYKRDILSWNGKTIRSFFEILNDALDRSLIKYALIDSFNNFLVNGYPYPFVEKKKLKPKAKFSDNEYEYQNSFLLIFYEGILGTNHRKSLRFFSENIVTKENISNFIDFNLGINFMKNIRDLENKKFENILYSLLPIDFGLLIQKDPSNKKAKRYLLSHFHVKVDWPIAEAAEDMGFRLKYISKDLYEHGEKYAELLQQKLFEYYGFHHTVGGRRSAAVVISQYFARENFLYTTYVSSKSSRALTKITENSISRYVLIKLSNEEMRELARNNNYTEKQFCRRYIIGKQHSDFIAVFMVNYKRTPYATIPEDGKLRELNPDYRWLTVEDQYIMPLPKMEDAMCIPYSTIYSS